MATLEKTRVTTKAVATVTATAVVNVVVRAGSSDEVCRTDYFNEWGVNLFGWNLTVAVSVDARPSRWGLFCQWFHKNRQEMPRGWVWHCSLAALTLCVGPVAVDVSVLRL